jgi:hypothetical protein
VQVDAVLAELDASARAVSAGGLLASKPAPSNGTYSSLSFPFFLFPFSLFF